MYKYIYIYTYIILHIRIHFGSSLYMSLDSVDFSCPSCSLKFPAIALQHAIIYFLHFVLVLLAHQVMDGKRQFVRSNQAHRRQRSGNPSHRVDDADGVTLPLRPDRGVMDLLYQKGLQRMP